MGECEREVGDPRGVWHWLGGGRQHFPLSEQFPFFLFFFYPGVRVALTTGVVLMLRYLNWASSLLLILSHSLTLHPHPPSSTFIHTHPPSSTRSFTPIHTHPPSSSLVYPPKHSTLNPKAQSQSQHNDHHRPRIGPGHSHGMPRWRPVGGQQRGAVARHSAAAPAAAARDDGAGDAAPAARPEARPTVCFPSLVLVPLLCANGDTDSTKNRPVGFTSPTDEMMTPCSKKLQDHKKKAFVKYCPPPPPTPPPPTSLRWSSTDEVTKQGKAEFPREQIRKGHGREQGAAGECCRCPTGIGHRQRAVRNTVPPDPAVVCWFGH